jgi:diguanylate cyclase
LSALPHTAVIIAAGVLAGLTLAALPLWWLHRAAAVARWQATHDDVTGLPNRRAVLTLLDRAARHGRPHGLVLLDLDRFKTVNDTYGHEAGNDLLGQVGARLAVLPPPVALAARLSGDEFALLVYGNPADVQAAAHAAWHAVRAAPGRLGHHTVPVQASVGYACARPGSTPPDLMRDADLAMYRAKTRAARQQRPGPAYPAPDPKPPGRCRDWPRP